jgi:hypothetical protein
MNFISIGDELINLDNVLSIEKSTINVQETTWYREYPGIIIRDVNSGGFFGKDRKFTFKTTELRDSIYSDIAEKLTGDRG